MWGPVTSVPLSPVAGSSNEESRFDSGGLRVITIMTVSLGLLCMLVFMLMVSEAPGGLRLRRS